MALHFGRDAPYAKNLRQGRGLLRSLLTSDNGLVSLDGEILEYDFGNGIRHETDERQTDPSTVSFAGVRIELDEIG